MSTATVDHQVQQFRDNFRVVREEVSRVIVGNDDNIVGVMTCLLAGGHVLLEGVPGLGKTMLVRTLAEALRPEVLAHPVHARPDAGRHHRHQHRRRGRRGRRKLRVPARPDLRQHGARRRDQPRHAQDAVARCSRPCRRTAVTAGGRRHPLRASRSSCWPRRTRSRWKAPTRCPRRSSTASSSSCIVGFPSRGRAARDPRSHHQQQEPHGRSACSGRARCWRCGDRRAACR